LGRRGVVDTELPRAMEAPIYARFGDLMALLLGLALLLVSRPWSARAPVG